LAAILLAIWGLKRTAEHGLGSLAGVLILAGLALAGVFLPHRSDPLDFIPAGG
jgi:hypothetical protein